MNAIDTVAMATLAAERRKRVMDALYYIAMSNAETQDIVVLCRELGVDWTELRTYRPEVIEQPEPTYADYAAPF